ncbi:hypothetical protein FIBSPDRAFT_732744 [Athelia psychrophila]|uniref:BTB domain-containing protein n=1 Tax=Athelia psychrophila TaxID=1759441 RepID=A0A166PJV8_9AGAM|nr:hypothetical protein FIBSPDRAFT_732744 [Fibularhizoctonia sp. CBS 109695]
MDPQILISGVRQVENTLFKVPRYKFERGSTVFKDMFEIPAADTQEGRDDANPIKLESIKKLDFQRFLMAMLPDYALEPIDMGHDEWISVLKLSTLWEFSELRREAISNLDGMKVEHADKVTIARAYRVERWLIEGYTALIKQDTPFTASQKAILGAETIIQLYERREETFRLGAQRLRAQLGQSYSQYGSGYSQPPVRVFDNLDSDLRQMFQTEFRDAQCEEDVSHQGMGGAMGKKGKSKKKFQGAWNGAGGQ